MKGKARNRLGLIKAAGAEGGNGTHRLKLRHVPAKVLGDVHHLVDDAIHLLRQRTSKKQKERRCSRVSARVALRAGKMNSAGGIGLALVLQSRS